MSRLDGAHVFVTGATGFVGQAILERLLGDFPSTRVTVLIRKKGSVTPEARLVSLLRKPVFASLRERVGDEAFQAQVAERVSVLEGDLGAVVLPSDVDVVIHSASTVSFDPPIDEAFATNVGGARALYEALASAGIDPHVVHVSTAYVGGIRKGVLPEAALTHTIDWRAEAESAAAARVRVEQDSRDPGVLRMLIAKARAERGKQGPQAIARAAEEARVAWVTEQLVEFGRSRAESLGWTDVYTLTKAFAERAAEELWASAGHRLSIVRPSVIESALSHPFPGWIDGFKVADPLILAYGRGQLPEFPGLPDSVLDIIPVDYVVNAVVAVAETSPEPAEPAYYHVASGHRNPLPFHRMYENVHEFFTNTPLPGEDGDIDVPVWQFPGGRRVERSLARRERAIDAAEWALARLPRAARTRRWLDAVQRRQGELTSLRAFIALYRSYVQTELIFLDSRTRALHESLDEGTRAGRGFDVSAIDWDDYLQRVHFPAVTKLTRAFANRSSGSRKSSAALPVRSDVVAIFDLENTVLDWNLIEQYLRLRLESRAPVRWPVELAELGASLPRYAMAERRDRGEFIRTFMRRYEGFDVATIRRLVAGRFGRALAKRTMADALDRVRAHREAGHRTILVTGMIDLVVEHFAPYFDEVVAGRMHERDGVLTGYLASPPLVDEARAAWLRDYADTHGVNLAHSYGYGDSHADLPWLSLLGHPNAVNPDAPLYRYAQTKRWPVLDWKSSAGAARVQPSASSRGSESPPKPAPLDSDITEINRSHGL